MTIRRHPISGEPVLFAPQRARRPHAFDPSSDRAAERCPFCPGHEEDTPEPLLVVGSPWRIRVFPNKYPPVAGAEVIVESARHDASFADVEDAEEAVGIWQQRLDAHRGAAYVALFRNEGARAGASIAHLHSQIVPLPFVPPRIVRETEGFRSAGRCPLCHLEEFAVVAETERFRWITPEAARLPYEQWIVPRRHCGSLTALGRGERAELAELLRASSKATSTVARSYNWMFMNFADPAGHFYVDVLPRAAALAGLELGSETWVQIVEAGDAARRLRS